MTLRGHIDRVSSTSIRGWAWDSDEPDVPVSLVVSINGTIVGRCLASRYRPDLEKAGIGDGRHAFTFTLEAPLTPLARHVVAVRREGDGKHLRQSPSVLEPARTFGETRSAIAQILTTVDGSDDLASRLAFVTDMANQLRQLHADRQSDADARATLLRQGRNGDTRGDGSLIGSDQPRALVIDDRLPQPDHDAGSNAILSHMRALQRIGYAVTFVPVDLHGDDSALAAEGITCCLHPWYGSVEEVLRRQRGAFSLVYLHRITTAGRYVLLARDYQPKARVIYSVADLHHLRLTRQAEVEGRPELAAAGAWMRTQELTTAWLADAVITHSAAEAAVLRRHMEPRRVHVVPWSLMPRPTAVPFEERRGLAFIGGYGHRPNVDAALWLVEAVLPEVEALGERLPCLLIGSDMPEVVRGLRGPVVDPIGQVDDLAHVFDRVRLTVAPLAFGAGVKGKVLDSLAAGVPCVCTAAAAEGLDLPGPLLNLVAETPAGLARSILALHEDEALHRICVEAGLAYITAVMGEARVDELLQRAISR